jgi:hypothetical protein
MSQGGGRGNKRGVGQKSGKGINMTENKIFKCPLISEHFKIFNIKTYFEVKIATSIRV